MMSLVSSFIGKISLEGDKEIMIEVLMNGHVSEEAMRDYERRQKQRRRSAFDDNSALDPQQEHVNG